MKPIKTKTNLSIEPICKMEAFCNIILKDGIRSVARLQRWSLN